MDARGGGSGGGLQPLRNSAGDASRSAWAQSSDSIESNEGPEGAEAFSFLMSSESGCQEVYHIVQERIKDLRGSVNAQGRALGARTSSVDSCSTDNALDADAWLRDSNEKFGRRFGYVLQKETGTPETVQAMDNLFANAHTSSFRHGDLILPRGSTERRLYHIVSGTVIFKSAEGQVLVRLTKGEIFGKTSFLETGNRGANTEASAEGDVTTVELNHDIVQMLSALDPNVGRFIYRSLAVSAASRLRGQLKALDMLVHY